jgi:hypothetical protein
MIIGGSRREHEVAQRRIHLGLAAEPGGKAGPRNPTARSQMKYRAG